MAKTSISPESEKPVTSAVTTVERANPPALPAKYNPDRYDDVSRDIQVPVLGLVNKIGPLSEKFPKNVGEFVLGDTVLLGERVGVIPVGILKLFIESMRDGVELKFGSPESATAKIFATANDAYNAGYAVDFDSNVKNRVEESSRVAFLVVAPAGDQSGEFVMKTGDLKLALAKSSYRRGGHRGVFRPLVNHAVKIAREKGIEIVGLSAADVFEKTEAFTHLWTVSSTKVENAIKKQAWYEPRIAKTAPLAPEVVEWIKENYSGFQV